MPYIIRHEWGKWVIRKKWTGKKVGTTDSRSKALGMVRAIYAHKEKR